MEHPHLKRICPFKVRFSIAMLVFWRAMGQTFSHHIRRCAKYFYHSFVAFDTSGQTQGQVSYLSLVRWDGENRSQVGCNSLTTFIDLALVLDGNLT